MGWTWAARSPGSTEGRGESERDARAKAEAGPPGPAAPTGDRTTGGGTNTAPATRSRVGTGVGAAEEAEDELAGAPAREPTGEGEADSGADHSESIHGDQHEARRRPRETRRHPSGSTEGQTGRPRPPGANLHRRAAAAATGGRTPGMSEMGDRKPQNPNRSHLNRELKTC